MTTRGLDVEIAFFDQHREEFVRKYPARYLLIKGNKLHGDFDTLDAAIIEGVRRFGAGPFLARRAGEGPLTLSVPARILGVSLAANSHESVSLDRQ